MCVLVVGGDNISSIEESLQQRGINEILHWSCRKRSEVNRGIPQRVDYLLMLTSYLKHSTMKKLKADAKKRGLTTVYAKRNTIDVEREFPEVM